MTDSKPTLTPADLDNMSAAEIMAAQREGRIRPFTSIEREEKRQANEAAVLAGLAADHPEMLAKLTGKVTK